MDNPSLAPRELKQALQGLARINRLSFSAFFIWRAVRKWARARGAREIKVLDLACGRGDVLIELARLAQKEGFKVTALGLDMNERVIRRARALARLRNSPAHFLKQRIPEEPLPAQYDVAISTLFFHHLTAEAAIKTMAAVRLRGVKLLVLSDLERSKGGYALARCVPPLLSRSKVVHSDATASVEAAFQRHEFEALLSAAELKGARIRRIFPCRFMITWHEGNYERG